MSWRGGGARSPLLAGLLGLAGLVASTGLTGSAAAGTPVAAASASAPRRPAVVEHRVIGTSVEGRDLHAWRLGNPRSPKKVVVLAAIHGDERAPSRILWSLRDGRPVHGVDLWLVPTYNPDGVQAHSRYNADGVDLNRNFPREWVHTSTSGPEPRSEPETVAISRFLRRIDPKYVISFHQPLHGVDTYGSKKRWFARRLAEDLHLPRKDFACGSGCHGTLTQWFNNRFDGVAVTVEYGRHPAEDRMTIRAPRQLLRALNASR